MIFPIVAYGHPVLREVANDITPAYPELPKLIEDMWETMYASNGVGLAAPQINKPIRLFVVDSALFHFIMGWRSFILKNFLSFNLFPILFVLTASTAFRMVSDRIKEDRIKAEKVTENLKTELVSMRTDPSIEEKRNSLNIFSNELFALLSTIRYDLAKLHWLECANAFGEGRPGNWVSKSESAANPYGQQNCVETKTTLNFVAVDSTKKL